MTSFLLWPPFFPAAFRVMVYFCRVCYAAPEDQKIIMRERDRQILQHGTQDQGHEFCAPGSAHLRGTWTTTD